MITVYYDGGCGMCSREIAFYRKKTPKKPIRWVDITTETEELAKTGLSFEEAMLLFTVKDEDGHLLRGVDAFALLWQHFRLFDLLAKCVKLPGIYQIANLLYARFSRSHFNARMAGINNPGAPKKRLQIFSRSLK